MISRNVKFNNVDDVIKFVNILSQYPFEVDIAYRRHLIDGKSILGMMGVGVGRDMRMKSN